jgi:EmrB/QacA subfamily drug resistance transporter
MQEGEKVMADKPARRTEMSVKSAVQQTRLGFVLTGLLLGMFISAMDNTIVATAMGTIVAHLGGLDKFVWVTSAYMVTEMAGMPIFGKLSDMYGRKRFFIFGLVVFLVASMLCGTAQNIEQLAIYRAIQGIGGGALTPIVFTIIFDIVPADKTGKFSGMFGAVFGIASIFGPLLGAYITDHFSWRFVFYINLPIGVIAFVLMFFFYYESRRHDKQSIDWLGVISLVPAVVSLMFALQLGGSQYAWHSTIILELFTASAILFIVFLYAEAKAALPIISYDMFRKRLFAGSNLVGLFTGSAFVVAVMFIPIYIQGVLGGSATNAGLVLLPMMLGSSISAPIGGNLCNKVSYRKIMFVFCFILGVGIYLLSTLTVDTSRLLVTLYMVLVGFGIGASFSVLSMAAMHHFDERQRGSASATLSFVRELGMTIGITVFGIIQRNAFQSDLKSAFAGMSHLASSFSGIDPRDLLSPALRAHIPGLVLPKLTTALSASIADTFVWTMIPTGFALLFVFWIGKGKWQGFRQSAQVPQGE